MSPIPFKIILKFSSDDSNSVQSLQFSSLLFSLRLYIFHFPSKKSKSFCDDVDDAVSINSSFASKFNLGIFIVVSVFRSALRASPMSLITRSSYIYQFVSHVIPLSVEKAWLQTALSGFIISH